MAKPLELTGQTFGYLTALSPTDKRDKDGNIYWLCECNRCGKKTEAIARDLKRGNRTSCGCVVGEVMRRNKKQRSEKFGGTDPDHYKMKTPTNNTTGVKGVSKYYRHGVFGGYKAYITFKGKQIHGGVFKTLEDAKKRREELESIYFDL